MSVRNDIVDNLLTEIKVLRTSSDYEAELHSDPVAYHENYLTTDKRKTPMLMVVDLGNETVLVRDASYTRYAFDVQIRGFVSGYSWPDTQEKLNKVIGSVKKFIAGNPDLGSAVLGFRFVEGMGSAYDGSQKYGETDLLTRIIYVVENGKE